MSRLATATIAAPMPAATSRTIRSSPLTSPLPKTAFTMRVANAARTTAIPATWMAVTGWSSHQNARAVEITGINKVSSELSVIVVWLCAQLMRTCPLPGSSTIVIQNGQLW